MHVTLIIITSFLGRCTYSHYTKGKTKVRRVKELAQGYVVEKTYSVPGLLDLKAQALFIELHYFFIRLRGHKQY